MPEGTITGRERWSAQYEQLRQHMASGGTYPEERRGLGGWIFKQRSMYRRGALPEDRVRLLEELPGWAWGARTDHWGRRYNELREHLDRHGAYPARTKVLGRWVLEQSAMFKRGSMPAHRVELLEALPGWVWRSRVDRWDEYYERVRERLSCGEVQPGKQPKLDAWMTRQRQLCRRGALAAERIEKLEALPDWKWDVLDDRWDEQYSELREHLARGGMYPVCGPGLGNWVRNQRRIHRSGALPAERVKLLEALPHWKWNVNADRWTEFYEELRQHLARGGAYPVQGRGVGSWITRQRLAYHGGELSTERIKLLEALPGWQWRMSRARRQ